MARFGEMCCLRQCFVCLVLLLCQILGSFAEELCDQCHCYISDVATDRNVRNVKPKCNEGTITWSNPIGDLRIRLHPGYNTDFRACFSIDTRYAVIKVSQEIESNSKNHNMGTLPQKLSLKTVVIVKNRTKEICIPSSSHPVYLYLESTRSKYPAGIKKVVFNYIIQTRPRSRTLKFNPMEACRPCSDRELIRAYCSSDFVVMGKMYHVEHLDDIEKTAIHVNISRVVRQRGDIFTFHNGDRTLRGKIYAPRKCGVHHGNMDFMFTGQMYLGKLSITCAPYLEDWRRLLKTALLDGTMECSL